MSHNLVLLMGRYDLPLEYLKQIMEKLEFFLFKLWWMRQKSINQ